MTEREYPEELRNLAEMEESRDRRPTVAQTLAEMGLREVELWHTPDEEAWATFHIEGRRVHAPIRSKGFRGWLSRRFYEAEGRVPGAQALQDALSVLEGEALYGDGDREHQVFVRVGGYENAVYVDLGNDYVEVTRDGWRIVADSPVRFWRPRGFLPLPTPVRGGSLDELRRFIRAGEDDFTLIVAWILGAVKPTGPYPILDVSGEQGTGKTTACKVIRALVDPHEAPLVRFPRDERSLFVKATNSHILAFDNLSTLSDWASDALCSIVVGSAYTERQLYSDRDEVIMKAINPVAINGIPELTTRADLRDRTLLVTLDKLDDADRVDEKALLAEFESARPRLLGAILDAVSAALRHWDDVKMDRKPRMVDFARWVAAAELGDVLPWRAGRFLDVYMGQRDSIAAESLESDPLAQAILQLVEGSGAWTGTASELLVDLGAVADDQTKKSKTWPQTPRNLSNRLRRLAPDLRKGAEIEIEFDHREGKDRRRMIRIWRKEDKEEDMCKSPSASSASSADAEKARGYADFRRTQADAGRTQADAGRTQADAGRTMADDGRTMNAGVASAREAASALGFSDVEGSADDADGKPRHSSQRVVDEL